MKKTGEYQIENNNRYTAYYDHSNRCHREDGPAIVYHEAVAVWGVKAGDKDWYQRGKRHRLDGPAKERVDGEHGWYIEDQAYTREDWESDPRTIGWVEGYCKPVELEL